MESVEKPQVPDLVDELPQVVTVDLRKFNRSEQMVLKAVTALTAIDAVEDMEQCNIALATLKEAKTVSDKIEEKRKQLGAPFFEAKKKIDDYAKALVITLPVAMDTVKKKVLAFQKEETERAARERKEARELQLLGMGMEKHAKGFAFHKGKATEIITDPYMIEHLDDEQWAPLITQLSNNIANLKRQDIQAKKNELEEIGFFGTEEETEKLEQELKEMERPDVSYPVSIGSSAPAAKVKGSTKRWTYEVIDETLVPKEYLIVDEKKIVEAIRSGTRSISGVRIFQQEGLTIR